MPDGMNMDPALLPGGLRYGRKDDNGGRDNDPADAMRQLKAATDKVRQFAETAATEMKNLGKLTEETKGKADEALAKFGEAQARLTEVEQKLARTGNAGNAPAGKTLGELVVESEGFKSQKLAGGGRGSFRVVVDRKDIMNVPATVGPGTSTSNSLVPADRQPGLVAPPERKLTVRDLLLPGSTSSNSIEYAVETGFTNNAAPVAEGATKPKSDIIFNLKNAPVRTIAHIFKASRQILDDALQLQSYIDGRARYGLRLKEEQQLLTGNGAGVNLLGIVPQATAFAAPTGIVLAGMTAVDRLRVAVLQASLAEYPPSGFVLHLVDWALMEMSKDSTGRYIFGDPQGVAQPRLWGLPVVATQAMAQNSFLTGAFNIGAQIFDRMEIEVLLSTENADDFERNMVTIRAEERLGLCVYRPEAFITGALTS